MEEKSNVKCTCSDSKPFFSIVPMELNDKPSSAACVPVSLNFYESPNAAALVISR